MAVLAVSAPFFRDFLTVLLTAVLASLPLPAAAIVAARVLRRRRRAALASLALRTALFLQAALCLGCFLLSSPQVAASRNAVRPVPRLSAAPAGSAAVAVPRMLSVPPAAATEAVTQGDEAALVLPSLAFVLAGAIWMTGSGLILLGLAFSAVYLQWLRQNSHLLPPNHSAYQLLRKIDRVAVRATLLRTSPYVCVPFAAGPPFTRPSLFLPTNYDLPPSPLCDEATAAAVLCHEMAHLRRHDLVWNVLGKLAVLLFWPNPLQWLLLREMEITAELACDDEALRQTRGSVSLSNYAHCLLTLTAQSSRINSVFRHNLAAMVAAPTSLTEERIENIMADKDSNPAPEAGKRLRIVLFSSAALLSGVCLFATAQIAPAARIPQIAPPVKSESQRIVELIDARDEPAISVLGQIVRGSGLEIDADTDVKQTLNREVTFKATQQTVEDAIALTLRSIYTEKLPLSFAIEGNKVHIFTARVDDKGLPVRTVSLNYTRPTQMSSVLNDLFRGTGFTVDAYSVSNAPVRVRVTDVPLRQAFEKVLQMSPDPLKYSTDKGVVKLSLVNPPPPVPPVITKELPTRPVSANFKDVSVRKALDELFNQARCDFSMTNEVPNTDKITDAFRNLPLSAAIPRILKMSSVPLDYSVENGVVIVRAAKQK